MTTLAFLDTETTGLDPERHEIWEVGLILRDEDDAECEFVAQAVIEPGDLGKWCTLFSELTHGAHLVGAVVSFDEERLRRLLRANGECPMWHYHLADVEALAAGWIAGRPGGTWVGKAAAPVDPTPPWRSDDLSLDVGVDPDKFDRHTALGDARWAMAIYDAVMSGNPT